MTAPPDTPTPRFGAALHIFYQSIPAERKRQLWLVLFLSILGGVAELITIGALVPFLSLLTTGDAGSVPGAALFLQLIGGPPQTAATILFIAAAVIAGAIRLLLAWSSLSFVERLGHDISIEIQHRILAQPFSYHLARNSSETVAALELVHQLTYGVIQQLIQAFAAVVIGLFVIAGIAAVDARTALLSALVFGLAYAIVVAVVRRGLRNKSTIIAAAYSERVKLIQESIGGIRDVIVDAAQNAHVEAFRAADARLMEARMETILASNAPRFLIESLGMIILALIALALSRSEGGLIAALPVLGVLALGAQRLLPLVNQLYQGWSLASANSAIAGQVAVLLSLPVPGERNDRNPLGLERSIEFRDVGFTYPGRRQPALTNVDIAIPKGKRVALVGATGSGKSSLADLLMGLIEPSSGSILVDGQPIEPGAWQRTIAHVPQSIFLADASIGRNIALSRPAQPFDAKAAETAASIAQLDEFLDGLPDGLETIVGERGVRLSGGQRQRIGIARALYKDAPVLILDEATSALDEATESALLSALSAARPDLTLIIISHRQSTIERCDLILRIEEGRLLSCP